jgi:hypothetical protein
MIPQGSCVSGEVLANSQFSASIFGVYALLGHYAQDGPVRVVDLSAPLAPHVMQHQFVRSRERLRVGTNIDPC